MPSVGTWLDQASIWPTATLIVSCAQAGAAKPDNANAKRMAKKWFSGNPDASLFNVVDLPAQSGRAGGCLYGCAAGNLRHGSAVSRVRVTGVWIEQLLALDLVVSDRFLAFGR